MDRPFRCKVSAQQCAPSRDQATKQSSHCEKSPPPTVSDIWTPPLDLDDEVPGKPRSNDGNDHKTMGRRKTGHLAKWAGRCHAAEMWSSKQMLGVTRDAAFLPADHANEGAPSACPTLVVPSSAYGAALLVTPLETSSSLNKPARESNQRRRSARLTARQVQRKPQVVVIPGRRLSSPERMESCPLSPQTSLTTQGRNDDRHRSMTLSEAGRPKPLRKQTERARKRPALAGDDLVRSPPVCCIQRSHPLGADLGTWTNPLSPSSKRAKEPGLPEARAISGSQSCLFVPIDALDTGGFGRVLDGSSHRPRGPADPSSDVRTSVPPMPAVDGSVNTHRGGGPIIEESGLDDDQSQDTLAVPCRSPLHADELKGMGRASSLSLALPGRDADAAPSCEGSPGIRIEAAAERGYLLGGSRIQPYRQPAHGRMEDRLFHELFNCDGEVVCTLLVADGHGGDAAAEMAVMQVPPRVKEAVKAWKRSRASTCAAVLKDGLVEVVKNVDQDWCSAKLEDFRRWAEGGRMGGQPEDPGCTILLVVVTASCAVMVNLGDSRAVVVRSQGSALQARQSLLVARTLDQHAGRPSRALRIIRSEGRFRVGSRLLRPRDLERVEGNILSGKSAEERVVKCLAPAHVLRKASYVYPYGLQAPRTGIKLGDAMGDVLYKFEPALFKGEPDGVVVHLEPGAQYLVLVATDGLWDAVVASGEGEKRCCEKVARVAAHKLWKERVPLKTFVQDLCRREENPYGLFTAGHGQLDDVSVVAGLFTT